jgi:internalin A
MITIKAIKATKTKSGAPLQKLDHENQWGRPGSYYEYKSGQLTILNLSDCKIAAFEIISELAGLKKLVLSKNHLERFEINVEMPHLELLDISYNEAEFELRINAALPNLEFLYVYKAKLNKIHFKNGLPPKLAADATNLNLHENPLTGNEGLQPVIDIKDAKDRRQQLVDYFKAAQSTTTVKRLKLMLLGNTRAGKTTLHDIITGANKAVEGSTHGVHVFSMQQADEGAASNSIQVQGFDFGGQDYYHNTHYSFFEQDALYILVWGRQQPDRYGPWREKPEHEEEFIYPRHYWLDCVQAITREKNRKSQPEQHKNMPGIADEAAPEKIAEETPPAEAHVEINAPLYLLQNTVADKELQWLNQQQLVNDFTFIKSFHHWNLHQEADKEIVKQWIRDLVKQHAQTRELFSVDQDVIAELKNKTNDVLLSLDELMKFNALTEFNKSEAISLAKRLHNAQQVFYRTEAELKPGEDGYDPLTDGQRKLLTGHLIINLTAFTGWIYLILKKELRGDGYFSLQDAESRVAAHEKAKKNIQFIIAFMLHEKIIFHAPDDDNRFFAPQYLTHTLTTPEALFLEAFEPALVKYEFTGFYHSSILSKILARFIENIGRVKTEKPGDAKGEVKEEWRYLLWKNKILLYDEAQGATEEGEANKAVKEAPKRRLLYIHFDVVKDAVTGTQKPLLTLQRFARNHVKDGFLYTVMEFIEKQIAAYACTQWLQAPGGEYVPMTALRQQNENDKGQPSPLFMHGNKLYRKGDFKRFLTPAEQAQMPMKKIFISYSKNDLSQVNQFLDHLAPLKRDGLIETWYCAELIAGSDWNAEIKTHFEAADIICFMVSASFLATDYIYEQELKKAVERYNAEKSDAEKNDNRKPGFKIVPIILDFCLWNVPGPYSLGRFSALPFTAKPVKYFDNANMAWLVVAECLRLLVRDLNIQTENEDGYSDFVLSDANPNKQLRQIFEDITQGGVFRNRR